MLETKQEIDPVLIHEAKGLEHSIREKLKTFLEEKINISFGCLDSRKFAEIGRDRLAVGIPRKLFKTLTD